MKQNIESLKQVAIAEITPDTDVAELLKIVAQFNDVLRINLGVKTGGGKYDQLLSPDEKRIWTELCRHRKKFKFETDLHLNGEKCDWLEFRQSKNIICPRTTKPNRMILNLDTISYEDYHYVVKMNIQQLGWENIELCLLNCPATNAELARLAEDSELAILEHAAKFLNELGFSGGKWSVKMPLFGSSEDYEWCGEINSDMTPDNVAAALDWIAARYGCGAMRVMTHSGVLTNKETDPIKVGDFFEAVAQWVWRARTTK